MYAIDIKNDVLAKNYRNVCESKRKRYIKINKRLNTILF